MYQDEHEEVIHDTLNETPLTDRLLLKHLRALVQEEISKRFDEQPTSYNSFKEEEMENLVNRRLDWLLESDDFKDKLKEEMDNYIDDCYVEVDTTAYITKG